MMDQTDGIARRQCIVQTDEGRQREAIDDRPRSIGDAVPCRSSGVTRSFVRQRMRACQFNHTHGVARLAQARDDAPVVFVSAGDRVERRRHDQRKMHQAIAAS